MDKRLLLVRGQSQNQGALDMAKVTGENPRMNLGEVAPAASLSMGSNKANEPL
jgi:hypothetical protein